jgi:hypothetical protein
MAMNYSKGKALGNNQIPQFDVPPPVKALASRGSTNQVASSVITLTEDTTAIEVATAGAGGVVMKWITTGDTSGSVFGISSVGATFPPNFDHAVPVAEVRRFVVPIESQTSQGYGSMMGANRENGLYRRVAVVSTGGTSSVMVTEY